MIVNDINYLEVSNEEIIGGVVVPVSEEAEFDLLDFDFDFDRELNIDKKIFIDADSTVITRGKLSSIEIDVFTVNEKGFPDHNQNLVVVGALVEVTTVIIAGVA